MPNNNPVFVFDGKLCKFEGMTKEQIINAIAQATGVTPSDVDAGFISTIVEQNKSASIHFWFGTQAEYDALESYDSNTFYIIDGDSTIDDLEASVENCEAEIDEVREDIQDIQNIFTFDGHRAGFSTLKSVYAGATIHDNSLPSAGLYILYVRDATGLVGSDTDSSIIVYYDGGSEKMFTGNFTFKYYNSSTSALETSIAVIMFDNNGKASLLKSYANEMPAQNYNILYRKIG